MSHWNQNATSLARRAPSPVFRLQAPGLVGEPLSASAALDAALALARRNGEMPCASAAAMHCMMVEPILAGTYVLVSMQDAPGVWRPVGWLAYALFDAEAESRYVDNPLQFIKPADWNKGDRLWMLHWLAEPGFTRHLLSVVRPIFGDLTARSLPRRGGDHLTIWRGPGCAPHEAAKFWQRRPVLNPPHAIPSDALRVGSRVAHVCTCSAAA